jgi:threonine synthase
MTYLDHFECSECNERLPADVPQSNTCKDGGLLYARYDLERLKREVSREQISCGPASMWRYGPLLPVDDVENAVTLGEGWTPLYQAERLAVDIGAGDLLIKNEGMCPTGSFKDRGAAVTLSRYRELGIQDVILNSSGNAGGAFSLYAARAGMHCVSILPTDSQTSSKKQSSLAGGERYLLSADRWHEAGGIVDELAERHGWFNIGTMREPFRTEGKKTMGYEIAEQLGWEMPDVIVYPAGGGTGAIAIWKALQELVDLGWVQGKLPRMLITQYEGCAPIVKAFNDGLEACEPWGEINIPPGGLKAPVPAAGKQILRLMRETNGGGLAVSETEALEAVSQLAALEGVFACPEAGTTLAGLKKALNSGLASKEERVVLVITGSGLKSVPTLPEANIPQIESADDVVTGT